jgi:hypothetical protein
MSTVYTQKPAEGDRPKRRIITGDEMAVMNAQQLVHIMAHRIDHLKSARLLPEETILIDGRKIACYVVYYSQDDLKNNKAGPERRLDAVDQRRKQDGGQDSEPRRDIFVAQSHPTFD